jgi:4-amino-4-deoxy-L-arabinose transferase-like glycosyltransferase
MSLTASCRKLIAPIGRTLDAWFDLEPNGRALAILLLLFVVAWTGFHVIARASVDLNPDLLEMYAWSRHPSAGYYKHPPLGALIAAAWFAVFPATDWSFDLLAMVNAAVALFAVDRIARLYLAGHKRLLVPLLLLLTPFYQFHAQRFGANQVLLSTWPLATWCFLRAFATRGLAWSAAAGGTAALAMLGKYFSVYLIAAFIVAALAHPSRWRYLRSPSPWISAGVGLLVLAPHLSWLTTTAFSPFDYLHVAHGRTFLAENLASVATYLIGGLSYVALLLVAFALAVRPDRRLLREALWPQDADRRQLLVLLAAQLLLPALSAPFLGVALTSLWTMQSWFLLPIVLLMPVPTLPPRGEDKAMGLTRPRAIAVAGSVSALTLVALLAAPVVAWSRHASGGTHGEAYYSALGDQITREWHRHSGHPLRIVIGNMGLVDAVSFYSADHPDAVPAFDLRVVPWVTPERLAREGYAIVCGDPVCATIAERRAAAEPRAIRRELELTRSFLGRNGPAARFTVVIVPPAPSREAPK